MDANEKAAKLGAVGELKGFIKEMLAGHMGGKKPKAVAIEVEAGPAVESESKEDEGLEPGMLEKLMEACK